MRGRDFEESIIREGGGDFNISEVIRELEEEMQIAAANLEYERAALLRDQIMELKHGSGISKIEPKKKPAQYGGGKTRRSAKSKKR